MKSKLKQKVKDLEVINVPKKLMLAVIPDKSESSVVPKQVMLLAEVEKSQSFDPPTALVCVLHKDKGMLLKGKEVEKQNK